VGPVGSNPLIGGERATPIIEAGVSIPRPDKRMGFAQASDHLTETVRFNPAEYVSIVTSVSIPASRASAYRAQ